eukprot:CAMPEP_0182437514 /NCGR_PEP_ID=MMETSP1167-20130531/85096_1 /TAXON_ID=2988 /ORGANISM="Mallomonas Sp, Strain CCMP3275" /LENGTH=146 /DNA_ID=CAMNT_0024630457 /DNA_START=262 /DNA_END=702 /DNA_ORIENTATION=+
MERSVLEDNRRLLARMDEVERKEADATYRLDLVTDITRQHEAIMDKGAESELNLRTTSADLRINLYDLREKLKEEVNHREGLEVKLKNHECHLGREVRVKEEYKLKYENEHAHRNEVEETLWQQAKKYMELQKMLENLKDEHALTA